jgi:hypothetical protein
VPTSGSLFHEHFDRRIVLGMACLVAGTAVLSWSGTPCCRTLPGPLQSSAHALLVALISTSHVKSLSDPPQIVEIKGLVAGSVNIGLGLWMGGKPPSFLASLLRELSDSWAAA